MVVPPLVLLQPVTDGRSAHALRLASPRVRWRGLALVERRPCSDFGTTLCLPQIAQVQAGTVRLDAAYVPAPQEVDMNRYGSVLQFCAAAWGSLELQLAVPLGPKSSVARRKGPRFAGGSSPKDPRLG